MLTLLASDILTTVTLRAVIAAQMTRLGLGVQRGRRGRQRLWQRWKRIGQIVVAAATRVDMGARRPGRGVDCGARLVRLPVGVDKRKVAELVLVDGLDNDRVDGREGWLLGREVLVKVARVLEVLDARLERGLQLALLQRHPVDLVVEEGVPFFVISTFI